ncbi:MAG: hypothetical protein QOE14_162 [Humisphaera sp.]|nr:hypothetical protein [Humisphaera sp.]
MAPPTGNWQAALESFLAPWKHRPEVTGALVCGSYVTGNPSPRSDIDVHILLKPSTKWRERGNDVVDGFLVEYFANPPRSIRGYFREDYARNDHAGATQFVTGRILFDKTGVIAKLKREARKWIDKPFRKPGRMAAKSNGYRLWDSLDNFRDAVESQAPDLSWRYVHALDALLRIYAHHTGDCFVQSDKAYAYLTSDLLAKKYLQRPFSDAMFGRRFAAAMRETDSAKMLPTLEALTRYVHRKMGGFEIDGFRLRAPARVPRPRRMIQT